MSIKPPSDLLLDVARAADPATSAAAAERLAKIGGQAGPSDPVFSEVLNKVEAPSAVPTKADLQQPAAHFNPKLPNAPADVAAKKAYQGLEALLLQNVVATMLPDSSDIFGEGSAGAIWRSMLAEQLGADLAKKVDLGIMPRYLRTGHHAAKHDAVTGRAMETVVTEMHNIALKHT